MDETEFYPTSNQSTFFIVSVICHSHFINLTCLVFLPGSFCPPCFLLVPYRKHVHYVHCAFIHVHVMERMLRACAALCMFALYVAVCACVCT